MDKSQEKKTTEVVVETEAVVKKTPKKVEKTGEPEEKEKGVNVALVIVLAVVGVAILGMVVTFFAMGLIEALLSETGFLSGLDMSGQNNILSAAEELEDYCDDVEGTFTVGGTGMFGESGGVAGLYSCEAKTDEEDVSVSLVTLKNDFWEFPSNSNNSIARINAIVDGTATDSEDWTVLEDLEGYKAVIMRTADTYTKKLSYTLLAMEGKNVVRVYATDLDTIEEVLSQLDFSDLEALDEGWFILSQDAQVEEDLENVRSLLTKYMTNNRGNLPEIETVTASGFESYINGKGNSAWNKFYNNYFLKGDGNVYAPDGTKYQFRAFRSAQPDWAEDGENIISVFYSSTCKNDEVVSSGNARNFALTYPKAGETGAYICVDNTY